MKTVFLAIVLSFLGVRVAGATPMYAVDRFLNDTVSIAEVKCRDRGALEREYAKQGKIAEARSFKLAEATLCDCMPARIKELKTSLSKSMLQQKMTEAEFQNRYVPQIVNTCAAEQLKSTYGEGCAEAFSTRIKDSATYCGCVHQSLSLLTDSDIAQIGSESADYVPRAADAQKRGAPPPEQPPAVRRFSAIDAACRAK